jgi:hypothetical protein
LSPPEPPEGAPASSEKPTSSAGSAQPALLVRLNDAASKLPPWAWALLFSVALCLVGLSRFGFWDPWELKLAEQAREVARQGSFFDPSVAGRYPAARPLGMALSALGIKIFGASELGARIFIALCAVGALMAVYWAGAGLLRRRAALLATLVLGTMPLFVLEARQLTSDAPLIAALALALGGVGRYAWPRDGRRRLGDLAAGVAGLGIGMVAGGALLGIVLPSLALITALVIGYGLKPAAQQGAETRGAEAASPPQPIAGGSGPSQGPEVDDGTEVLAAPGVGPDVPAERPFGASTLKPGARGFPFFAVLAVAGLTLLPLAMTGLVSGKFSMLLGGVPRTGAPSLTFERLVRELGFGLFPWSAVALFALARPLIRLDDDQTGGRTNSRLAFVGLYLLIFAGFGFALSSYLNIITGDARYVALPAIALAIGAYLDEALEGIRPEPVAGLLMATGTMIIARDFFLTPEELASVHVREKIKWPVTISPGNLFLGVGFLTAMGVYAGLAARARALGRAPAPDATGPIGPSRPLLGRIQQRLVLLGRYGLHIAIASALFFAFYLTQGLVPRLSTHLSFKPVLESYGKFAKSNEKIGRYRVEGHGSTFYSKQTMVDLPNQERVVQFLRDPERVFAMVAADELAALDVAFKQGAVPYYAVDASSSRFLLLTNRLDPGQVDQNPLKKNVWTPPGGAAAVSSAATAGARPPWTWRVPVSATFGDAIELIGADFPESIRRPGKIPLDLIFRIKARPPGTYKIFVHFDGPAAPRVIGDHDPLNRTFGTSFWLPGEYIRDHYETDVPLMTTPAGTYTVLVGFWPGGEGKRLKVTQGSHDGADRVRLGTIEIK